MNDPCLVMENVYITTKCGAHIFLYRSDQMWCYPYLPRVCPLLVDFPCSGKKDHGDPLVEYWNDLKSALRKRHIPFYYERELMYKLHRLRQGSMSVKEYRQQMELLLLRARLREEERTSIARPHCFSLPHKENHDHEGSRHL